MPFDAQAYVGALNRLPRAQKLERLTQLKAKSPEAYAQVAQAMRASRAPNAPDPQQPFGTPAGVDIQITPGDRRLIDQQYLESKLGGTVDRTTELPGGVQAQLSRTEELPRALQVLDQSGELPPGTEAAGVQRPNGAIEMFYRDQGTNDYHSVNREGLSPGDVGATLGPILTWGNAAIIGTAPLTGPLGGLMRGGSWMARASRIGKIASAEFAANTAARGLDEYLETGDQTTGQIADKAMESGGVAVGARALFGGVGVFANVLARRTSKTQGEAYTRAREGVAAADRLGYPVPTLGQALGGRPRKAEAIAGVLDEDVKIRERAGLEAAARDLGAIAARPEPQLTADQILTAIERERAAVDRTGLEMLRQRGLQGAEGARYQHAGDVYRRSYRNYATAQQQFQRAAAERELAVKQQHLIMQPIDEFLKEAEDVFGPIQLARHMEVTPETAAVPGQNARPGTASQEPINLPPDLQPFAWLVNNIRELDPAQPAQYAEGLRRLETTLGAMTRPDAGFVSTRHAAIATRLYGALLEGKRRAYAAGAPPGVAISAEQRDAAEAAVREYRTIAEGRASQWRQFREVQDAHGFIEGMDYLGAGELAARAVLKNPTEDLANFMTGIMSAGERAEFRAGVAGQLLNNPDQIMPTLKGLGPAAGRLFDDDMLMVLESVASERARIDRGTLNTFLANMDKTAAPVRALVETDDIHAVRSLLRNRAITSEDVQTVVVADLVEKTTKLEGNRLRVSPQAYHSHLAALRRSNMWTLLPQQTKELLTNIEAYTSFVHGTADIQSGMVGGGMATAGAGFHGADAAKTAFIQGQWSSILASMTTNERVIRFWLGGKERISMPRLKQFGLGMAQWMARVNSTYSVEEGQPQPIGAAGTIDPNAP